MSKVTLTLAVLLMLTAVPAFAQVVVTSRPVVTYYAPTPVVTYSAPTYSAPTYSSRVVYDVPVIVGRPVTTYYAPVTESVPVTSYYTPTVTTVPVTTYYGSTVVSPVYASPVVVGRSAYGTLRPYVPGQPVLNTLRFALP